MNITYYLGTSWLYRIPAGLKLAAYAVFASLLVVFSYWYVIILSAVCMLCCILTSGIPWRYLYQQQRVFYFFWIVLGLWVGWAEGVQQACLVVLRWWLLVNGALLVMLSTSMTQMMRVIEFCVQPIRLIGGSPYKISVAIALTIRLIPVLTSIIQEVKEAQMVRGAPFGVRTMLVPVMLRFFQMVPTLAQAMDARGFDALDTINNR